MTSTGHHAPPAPLRWAVWLLAGEAVVTGLVAVWSGVAAVAGAGDSRGDAAALAGFLTLTAVALAGLTVALWRRRPRARAPAIVLQLLGVMFGYVLTADGGLAWVGVPAAVLAVAVVTLLLTPRTHAALSDIAPDGSAPDGSARGTAGGSARGRQ